MMRNVLYWALVVSRGSAASVYDTGDISTTFGNQLTVQVEYNSAPITFVREVSSMAPITDEDYNIFFGTSGNSTANFISDGVTNKYLAGSIVDEGTGMVYQISTDSTGTLRTTATHTSEFPPESDPVETSTVNRERSGASDEGENVMNRNEPTTEIGVLVVWTKKS